MDQELPEPPEELKPWYYQYWFFYPVIVFWPVWPVLVLRSPWHNHFAWGTAAFTMLIVGSVLIGRQIYENQSLGQFTTTIIIPGLILTVVTQALWLGRDRKRVREAMRQPAPPDKAPAQVQSRRARNRRRGARAGRSR